MDDFKISMDLYLHFEIVHIHLAIKELKIES